MKKCYSLRAKSILSIGLFVLLIIGTISILSNVFINKQFLQYVSTQQQQQKLEIVSNIENQYISIEDNQETFTSSHMGRSGHGRGMQNHLNRNWNIPDINNIGLYALSEGFIVRVVDPNDNIIWDAAQKNQRMCSSVLNDISHHMETKYPNQKGSIATDSYPLYQDDIYIGKVEISHYGPVFLREIDTQFLDGLNLILLLVGGLSFVLAIVLGIYCANKLSRPILKTSATAKQIADGDYLARVDETSTTTELHQLMLSINHLAESLDKQETLRKKLTADVAHELRTPLTTTSTHLEAMIEGVWEPTPQRLQSCYDEVARITTLVQDLENLARIEGDNLNLQKESTNLSLLVEKAIQNYDFEISSKELEILLPTAPVHAKVDPNRFYQVIHNLISNAVKYTPVGGKITIATSETSENIILTVADTGIGIAPEELPYIFERFYRTDKSRARDTGGAGVGITIAKSIVEAHGGKITVTSQPQKGSCFTITLPKEKLS